jgi:WD40 repeat protein/energy-coupling factor transporter ATP-binding protein EcfA2
MVSANLTDEKMNPFPGLRQFTAERSDLFFGRETESSEIAGKILRNRFVAVTGASGSGKSSLVLCGLIPALKKYSLERGEKWNFLTMRPGRDPFGNLANSFLNAINSQQTERETGSEIISILKESSDGIKHIINKFTSSFTGKTLLFIDQFEEVFSYCTQGIWNRSGSEIKNFVHLLTDAVNKGNPDFHLIIAIRSDLISECEQFRSFTELINGSSYLVSPLSADGIREAIIGPLKMTGVEIESDLVEHLINEMEESGDNLPVLQYTLMRIWMNWKAANEQQRPIGFADYSPVGSMRDGLSYQADGIYMNLDQESRWICEKMFRLLTGAGLGNQGSRCSATIEELKSSIPCSQDALINVIEEFRKPVISVLDPDYATPLTPGSLLELSHESVINLWGRLKKWVDEESESVQIYLGLSEASALYQQGKTGLLKSPDLQLALSWRDKNRPTLGWARRYNPAFERAMVYLRTSEQEFLESEKRKERYNKWRLKRIRRLSSLFGGMAVIAALIMTIALISKFSADKRRQQAEEERIRIEAQKNAAEKYAAAALKRSIEADSGSVSISRKEQMERMLRLNAENQVITLRQDAEQAMSESRSAKKSSMLAMLRADSARIAGAETQRLRMISIAKTMSLRSVQPGQEDDLKALLAYQAFLFNKRNNGSRNDADVYQGLYNLAKEKGSDKIRTYQGPSSQVRSIIFRPARNEYFTSDSEGRVMQWDMGETAGNQKFKILYTGTGIIEAMAVSPEADWLACSGGDNAIKMISLNGSGQNYDLRAHSGLIKSLIFSYDGRFLYSAAVDGKLLKWDLSTRASAELETGGTILTSLDLSSDNRFIAGITDQGNGYIMDPGKPSGMKIESNGRKIRSIRFKPDENLITVGYDDGLIEMWDVISGKKISELKAHSGEIREIRFSRGNLQMATSGSEGTLKLWDTKDLLSPPVCFSDNEGLVVGFEFSPDGEMIMAGSVGTRTRVIARPSYADSFAADGCAYITRNFTPDEWLAFVGRDIAYEKTCPETDYKIRIKEIR